MTWSTTVISSTIKACISGHLVLQRHDTLSQEKRCSCFNFLLWTSFPLKWATQKKNVKSTIWTFDSIPSDWVHDDEVGFHFVHLHILQKPGLDSNWCNSDGEDFHQNWLWNYTWKSSWRSFSNKFDGCNRDVLLLGSFHLRPGDVFLIVFWLTLTGDSLAVNGS